MTTNQRMAIARMGLRQPSHPGMVSGTDRWLVIDMTGSKVMIGMKCEQDAMRFRSRMRSMNDLMIDAGVAEKGRYEVISFDADEILLGGDIDLEQLVV